MSTPRVSHGLPLAITTAFLPLSLTAATTPQFWNPGGTGGDGVWGSGPADTNWNTSVGAATPNYAWPDTAGSVATFQDNVGGTATIFGQVSATGVQQNGAAYTIEGGTLRLIPGSAAEQPFIDVASGRTLNVTATVAGTAGLTKTGAGTLNLSGFNTFTGPTAINGGTLVLAGPNQLPDGGALSIAAGGTLALASGTETVASLVSNGGIIQGTGTLVASTYQLNNGSTVNANLGAGTLGTSGAVALNASSAAATVNVGAGALTLSGGNLADYAALTLAAGGGIVLNGSDTVGSLVSNGGSVSGPGTLTAASYSLNDGSSVAGNLGNGTITTNGSVSISGSTGSGSLSVASGTLNFTGVSAATAVQVASGATLQDGGNLANAAVLTNAGTLAMSGSDTIGQYISNGGILSGSGTLSAASYLLGNGSSVSGNLGSGILTINGAASITGTAGAATVNVDSGFLTLGGNNLSDLAAVHLAGGTGLVLDGSDTVGSLVSDGGLISGSGTLSAASYLLNDGTFVSGKLGDGTAEIHGSVTATGNIGASTINIVDGAELKNFGTLGTAATWLHLGDGASLVASGVQNFARLTTAGGQAISHWIGNLANAGTVAPGGDGDVGTLHVAGDFSTTGTLSLDLGAAGHDLVSVTGNANFGGVLEVNRYGATEVDALMPIQVVDADSYSGTFSALHENLDGVLFFNPTNGTLTRLGLGDGAAFLGRATPNQASTWVALYDDVVDPGTRNAFYRPGQRPPYELSSGIASPAAPDLLAALEASLSPAGLDAALLNRLSPEVYGSLSDYSLQALRNHHRSALTAPALVSGQAMVSGTDGGGTAPGSAKDAKVTIDPPTSFRPVWEIFAAADYFDTGTDASLNQGDYDLSGTGVIAGVRFTPGGSHRFRFSAWLAGDDGQIDGTLINADAKGYSFGLDGEALIPAGKRDVRVSAGLSYGSWEFDGSRGSASAAAGGWAPRLASFSDADADAFDAFVRIDSVVWRNETFRLTPSLGLSYSSAASDAFRELQGGAGSGIALAVDGAGRDSLAAQLGLAAEADLNRFVTLDGETGVQMAINEETERISGRFVSGSRPMSAILSPLSDDLFYLGAGATWHANERCQVRLGYRAEFRSDADALNAVNLSGSWRF